MKFKDLTNNQIIEIEDENKIKKFQGYPDLFEEIKEIEKPKENKEIKPAKEIKSRKNK